MDGCRIGVGRVDITPTGAGWPAGWSAVGRRVGPQEPGDVPLVGTAVVLEDASGERLVIVHADLHSAGAALWRRVAAEAGVPASRLILAGTHTHQGPGHLYGNVLFDSMTTPSPWPVGPRRAAGLARLLGRAVRDAVDDLRPGGIAWGEVDVPGIASNRALPAWVRNPEEERAAFAAGPGRGCGEGPLADRARDPRVRLLVAGEVGAPRAVLAWAAVHGTAHGPDWPRWSADGAGEARRLAEDALGVPVGLAAGPAGDISPLPCAEDGTVRASADRPTTQGADLARHVGEGIAAGLTRRVPDLAPAPFRLHVAHTLWRPADEPDLGAARYGLATLGGGVDGRNEAHHARVAAGVAAPAYARPWPPGHPHHPKVPAARALPVPLPLGALVRRLAPQDLPLHVACVGDGVLATVPGEPTSLAGWRIERVLLDATARERVIVSGYAGDYAGYWATPQEYDQQRYEGASTLFGRLSAAVLADRLHDLAIALPGPQG